MSKEENLKEDLLSKKITQATLSNEENDLYWSHDKEKTNTSSKVRNKLIVVIIFCSIFMVIEIVGGIYTGSLAILMDAAHMFSDSIGYFLSLISLMLSRKKKNNKYTYGYQRAEVLGALASIFIIWVLTILLVYEASSKLFLIYQGKNDKHTKGKEMFCIAIIGVTFNVILGLTLNCNSSNKDIHSHAHGHSHDHDHEHEHNHDHNHSKKDSKNSTKENYNYRAAVIHVIGDLIVSIVVVISSAFIWKYPFLDFLDPLCSIVFSIVVLFTTKSISQDCINVLMESLPKNFNIKGLRKELLNIEGVETIHDLHVWEINNGKLCLTVHIYGENDKKDFILKESTIISRKHEIYHSTIQVEDKNNFNSNIICKNNIHC